MLSHIGQAKVAEKIENAWLKTIEDGIHTGDIYSNENSTKKVGTKEFTEAVIERLGEEPTKFEKVTYPEESKPIQIQVKKKPLPKKTIDGVDVFICEENRDPDKLGDKLREITSSTPLELIIITNRGVKVYPDGNPLTFCTDHWRCRFQARQNCMLTGKDLIKLQEVIVDKGLEVIKTENLYRFDGELGYSLGQGQ